MGPDRLTAEELADRAGTSVERVRWFVELGIVEPKGGAFGRLDVMRVRVVQNFERMGIDAEAVAKATASGHLTLGYLESAGRRHPRSDLTFAELGDKLGLGFDTLERMYIAFGLPRPAPEELVRQEDVEIIETLPALTGAGVGEGDLFRMARVWGDSARRVAQFLSYYLHNTIEEPFRRRGLRDNEAFEAAIREVGVRVGRSGEDLLGWLFRRHSEVFTLEHQFEHVETALEQAGVRRRPPRSMEAAVFADLTGYTRFTEEAGDQAAADVSLRLAHLVTEVAARHRGEVVKMLGDGVYLHFRDPTDALRASFDIVEGVVPRGLPPAHIGANAGPMIYDEGDYFGRTVNIAARIAARADAHQVFVGEDVVRAVPSDTFRFVKVGDVALKGISQPLPIYEALPAESASGR